MLKRIWRKWKAIARKIGNLQARVILFVFYFSLFVPFSLGISAFGDPLRLRAKKGDPFWLSREEEDLAGSIEALRRQF